MQNDMEDYIINEKNLLEKLDHQFILKLHSASQDERCATTRNETNRNETYRIGTKQTGLN